MAQTFLLKYREHLWKGDDCDALYLSLIYSIVSDFLCFDNEHVSVSAAILRILALCTNRSEVSCFSRLIHALSLHGVENSLPRFYRDALSSITRNKEDTKPSRKIKYSREILLSLQKFAAHKKISELKIDNAIVYELLECAQSTGGMLSRRSRRQRY